MTRSKDILEGMNDLADFSCSLGMVNARLHLSDSRTKWDVWDAFDSTTDEDRWTRAVGEYSAFEKELQKQGHKELVELAKAVQVMQDTFVLKFVNKAEAKIKELKEKYSV